MIDETLKLTVWNVKRLKLLSGNSAIIEINLNLTKADLNLKMTKAHNKMTKSELKVFKILVKTKQYYNYTACRFVT